MTVSTLEAFFVLGWMRQGIGGKPRKKMIRIPSKSLTFIIRRLRNSIAVLSLVIENAKENGIIEEEKGGMRNE